LQSARVNRKLLVNRHQQYTAQLDNGTDGSEYEKPGFPNFPFDFKLPY